ncbi:DUF2716 domain-containing protein [Collimonas sp.]|jgi:hypothetical protein|uniref:DUF2716 domain-containing protein n=1 Tax=Collimonas sp. TaxID=1963772 RepID=UPI002C09CF8D|nr:DUF2716 domain-containing protein [Collimonas sp.]HWX02901.1 DUF2716 domain-containing protein [Collimonas sp.]
MRILENSEYQKIWDIFYERFNFRPSVNGPFPAISEPLRSITFGFAANVNDEMLGELKTSIFDAFEVTDSLSNEIYYLDWQHECYAINRSTAKSSWVNGFPDGDYAILLAKDMCSGTFGHPWEPSICLFGDEFVQAVLR